MSLGTQANLASGQPLYPFVEVDIAGERVSDFGSIANSTFSGTVIDFTYTRKMSEDTAANTFTLTLYDDTAVELETRIYMALVDLGNNNIKVRYGWCDHNGTPITSRQFDGKFLKYSLEFEGPSTILCLECQASQSNALAVSATQDFPPQTYQGRPDEIVKAICGQIVPPIEIGYIEPCEPVMDETGQPKTFIQISEGYETFIQEQLVEQAVSAETGETPYQFVIEDGKAYFCSQSTLASLTITANVGEDEDVNAENGGSTAGSAPATTISGTAQAWSAYYEYYAGQFNNQVISFAPELRDLIVVQEMSAGEAASVDATMNQIIECSPKCVDTERKNTSSDTYTCMGLSSSTRKALETKSIALLNNHYKQTYGATLEIMGDPNVKIMSYIYIAVYTKYGLLHHSSGTYWVNSAEDSISAGEFTTTLSLTRNNLMDMSLNQGAVLNPDGSYTTPDGQNIPSGDYPNYKDPGYVPVGGYANPLGSCRVTSEFGYRIHPISGKADGHKGIDLGGNAVGTPIYAAKAGTVKVSSNGWNGGYGNYIVIDHGDGTETRYAHCSRLTVSVGTTVQAGQAIAEIGSTGNSTGPHLHFEIRENGTPVDPRKYLSF